MNWKVVCFFLLFSIKVGLAATRNDTTKVKYIFGITPSAIINIVPAIQLSHDICFSDVIAVGMETAYIFSHSNINNKGTKGVRLRPQLKFTVFRKNAFNIDLYSFYNYRYYKAIRVEKIERAGGAFTEEVLGTRKTILHGYGMGIDFGFFNSNDFVKKINMGFGIGSGNINNEYSDPMFEPFTIFGFDRSGTERFPILFLHVNILLI